MGQPPTGPRFDCAAPIPRRLHEGPADRADSAMLSVHAPAPDSARPNSDLLEKRLRERTEQLHALARQLADTEQRERRRLAAILHDDLQQILVGAKLHLQLALSRTRSDRSLTRRLALVSRLLDQAIAKSRSLSHDLSVPPLRHGLIAALHWLGRHVFVEHGLDVTFVGLTPDMEPPTQQARTLAYSAVRELLFNVVKHSGVNQATITAHRRPEGLFFTVADAGRGFDPSTLAESTGVGLLNLRDRLQALGGRLDIRSAPGHGSQLTVFLPPLPPDPAPLASTAAVSPNP